MKNHIVNFCIENPNELEAGRINYEEESMEAYEEEGNSKEGKEEIANEEDGNKRNEVVTSSDGRLRVVPLSLCPSCVMRTKTARKKWLREIMGARSTRKEGLPPKPKSLPFHGRVIFRCRISYLDVFSLALVVNSRGRCFE